jgi:holo-[acyl-carrier protein] synthase
LSVFVSVGTDLVRIAEVAASVERFGDRYLERLFTEAEVAQCRRRSEPHDAPHDQQHDQAVAASLAARFAAKESLLKALRPEPARTPEWPTIEVVSASSGAPSLRLHGAAADLAAERGVTSLSVSLTHEGDYAGAVVVALCTLPPPGSAD